MWVYRRLSKIEFFEDEFLETTWGSSAWDYQEKEFLADTLRLNGEGGGIQWKLGFVQQSQGL